MAVPFGEHREVAKALPSWKGKTVIDAMNALVPPEELNGLPSSAFVAKAFTGAKLVKGFNHLIAATLAADPIVEGGHRVVFLSSDDEDAAAPVAALAKQLGFAPASCSRRIPMICSSLNRLGFIVRPPQVDGLYTSLAEIQGLRSTALRRDSMSSDSFIARLFVSRVSALRTEAALAARAWRRKPALYPTADGDCPGSAELIQVKAGRITPRDCCCQRDQLDTEGPSS